MTTDSKTPQKSPSVFRLFGKLKGNAEPAPVKPRGLAKAATSAGLTRPSGTTAATTPHLRETTTSLSRRSTGIAPRRSSKQLSTLTAHNSNPFRVKNGGGGGGGAGASGASASHTHGEHSENLVYNPYGINSRTDTSVSVARGPSSSGSRGGSTSNVSAGSVSSGHADLSFYMHDGDTKVRMLPLPIADPNEYLPEEIKQLSIHLSDNFVFDKENKTIGSGGSSEVRIVRSAYRQKDVYALKKLNMIYDESPEKFYKRCSKEFIIAKQLSGNIHITSTFYLVKVPTTIYTTRGWGFIMELGSRDLFQLMEKSGWKNVPVAEKFCLFKQVAQGVKFCHDNGVAHRDLKPENVLLSKDGVCKLTDFGISDWYREEEDGKVKLTSGMIGSPPYAPPEVMYWDRKKKFPQSLQKPYDPLKLDCYSLGVVFLTLVNNFIPFFESCNTDPKFREYESSYNNFIRYQNKAFRDRGVYKPGPGSEYMLARRFKSTDASRVAWRLADPDPETRYTIADLFSDPWFQAVETCVDLTDVEVVRHPQIRKTSSEGIDTVSLATATPGQLPGGTVTQKQEAGAADIPADDKKLRSMCDIAATPHKCETPLQKDETVLKDETVSRDEPHPDPTAVAVSPAPAPAPVAAAANASATAPAPAHSASSASNVSAGSRRKRVVHRHMDVPGSALH